MNDFKKILFADKIIKYGFWVTILLLFLILVITLFMYQNLPPLIPVYNQMPWGEMRLGERIEIFFPVLIASIFYVVNLFFGLYVYQKMPLISRTLCITGLLLMVMAFIFSIRTIQLIY